MVKRPPPRVAVASAPVGATGAAAVRSGGVPAEMMASAAAMARSMRERLWGDAAA